jgi:hypothetical protein
MRVVRSDVCALLHVFPIFRLLYAEGQKRLRGGKTRGSHQYLEGSDLRGRLRIEPGVVNQA